MKKSKHWQKQTTLCYTLLCLTSSSLPRYVSPGKKRGFQIMFSSHFRGSSQLYPLWLWHQRVRIFFVLINQNNMDMATCQNFRTFIPSELENEWERRNFWPNKLELWAFFTNSKIHNLGRKKRKKFCRAKKISIYKFQISEMEFFRTKASESWESSGLLMSKKEVWANKIVHFFERTPWKIFDFFDKFLFIQKFKIRHFFFNEKS